mgnify:CR=1 FL=1
MNVRRHRPSSGTVMDRHSFAGMWMAIGVAFTLANLVRAWCQTHHAIWWPASLQVLGLGLMGAGIGLRVYAIRMLGFRFTPRVAVQPGQTLVTTGPYRWVRHPTYTGLWLALIGVGVTTRCGWAALALTVIPFLGLWYRMRVEEQVLTAFFGDAYQDYVQRTWRLIPFIY